MHFAFAVQFLRIVLIRFDTLLEYHRNKIGCTAQTSLPSIFNCNVLDLNRTASSVNQVTEMTGCMLYFLFLNPVWFNLLSAGVIY